MASVDVIQMQQGNKSFKVTFNVYNVWLHDIMTDKIRAP